MDLARQPTNPALLAALATLPGAGTLGGGLTGSIIGAGTSLLTGGNVGQGALGGLKMGLATGAVSGLAQGFIYAKANNLNPWTGVTKLYQNVPFGPQMPGHGGATTAVGFIDPDDNIVSTPGGIRMNSNLLTLDEGNQGKHIQGHNNFRTGRNTIDADPNTLIGDLNAGRFKFIGTEARNGHPIVQFNYDIGQVLNVHGTYLGKTSYGVVHINGKGGVHIVPKFN